MTAVYAEDRDWLHEKGESPWSMHTISKEIFIFLLMYSTKV